MSARLVGFMLAVAMVLVSMACNKSSVQLAEAENAEVAATQGGVGGRLTVNVKPSRLKKDDINPPGDEIPELGTTIELSEDEWRDRLTSSQFRILRNAGTEFPGSGAYNKLYEDGTYHCSACNNPLFDAETKFDSKTGWPSFYQPIEEGRVAEVPDNSHGMKRTEVVCAVCGGHLGHLFNDGPEPTGLRYCINSVSLYFRPDGGEEVDPGTEINQP